MIDCSDRIVELAAIAGATVLGVAALIVDGDVGETIVVAIAAALGAVARHYWGGGSNAEEVQVPSNSS